MDIIMQGTLFIVSAPSGAGKTSLSQAVLERLQPNYQIERVITYTTRKPRNGEIPGKDYHFIAVQEFQQKIDEGFFLEWSSAYDHYYGTPISIKAGILQGKSYLLIVDRRGAYSIMGKIPGAVLIWITIPGIEVLRDRLEKRAQESPEQIERRLVIARDEIEQETKEPIFHYHILNDFFNNAVENLYTIMHARLMPRDNWLIDQKEL